MFCNISLVLRRKRMGARHCSPVAMSAGKKRTSKFRVDDPEAQARIAAFLQGLAQLGWTDGRNMRIDARYGAGQCRRRAQICCGTGRACAGRHNSHRRPLGPGAAALQATRTVPIVFAIVPDPVGSGFVESLARPGGNATGFMQFEYSLSGKWPELLKEIAPHATRAAILWDPALPAGIGQFAIIQAVAPSLGMEVSPVKMRDAAEIERRVAAFARSGNGGMIVTSSGSASFIVTDRHACSLAQLAAVYVERFYVTGGGLISYGGVNIDEPGGAAGYVDRILKGGR